jgi:hypothetical protein
MADIRITDLVDEKVFEDLNRLSDEIKSLKQQYVEAATELAKGLTMKISTQGDLDKFNHLVAESSKKAQQATDQLNQSIDKQRDIISQTTNTISRELAEIEKENKTKREAFEQDKQAISIAENLLGSRQNNILRLAEMQRHLSSVKKAQKELDDQEKSGALSAEKAAAARVNLIAKQREYQAAIKDLNLVLNNQEKQMQASEGSYQKLSLQLEMLKRAYKGLNDEEKESDMGKKLGEEIGNLDAHLKDLAADMGEFQRNTGNYAIANQNVKTELRELVQEIALLTIQYRNMSDEEKNSAQGRELEQKMYEMTAKAAELKDAIGDVSREIQSGANDTNTFSAFSEGINVVISGVGGLTAACHALGIGERDLIKIQTNLQAAMAASNAMTKAQNALQKESNLMVGVARIQANAHAMAIKMKTIAEGEGVVATKAATVAQAAFNAVARANPYVILATGIGLLIAAVVGLTKATKSETEEQRKFREETEKAKREYEDFIDIEKRLQEAREKGIESSADEIAKLTVLYSVATDVSRSVDERRVAVNKLQELYPDYLGNIEDEEIMSGKAEGAIRSLTSAIYDKAVAMAKMKMIEEYTETQLKKDKELKETMEAQAEAQERLTKARKEYEDKVGTHSSITTQAYGTAGVTMGQLGDSDEKRRIANEFKEAQEEVDGLNDKVVQLAKETQDAAEAAKKMTDELSKADIEAIASGGSKTKSSSSTPAKTEKQEITKTYEEIKEITLENTQEIIAERIKMTEKGSKEEYDLTVQYIEIEQQLREISIKKSYEKDKKALDEALKNKTVSQEEYYDSIEKLEEARGEMIALSSQRSVKAMEKAQEEYSEAYIKSMQKAYADEQEVRQMTYTRELTELAKQRSSKILSEEEYQRQLAEAQMRYAEETADKQIEMLEKVLEAEGLTADQRAKISKELAKVKADTAKQAADAELKNTKKIEKEEADLAKKREKDVKQYLKSVSDMVGKVSKLVSAIYEGQIQDIEKEQEESEKAHEAEIERIEQLEETGAISKEESEARKRAAEQRSAEKNEELEKKKQDLKYKQAVWDKATSIAQAGIATALAITEALPNIVLAAIVGAMGAIEIATIIATPIAAYAKGTKDKDGHPGGLAIVGDAGKREAVVFDNKMWITPDKPTIVDMPKGAIVYPDADKLPEPMFMHVTQTGQGDFKPTVIVNHDSKKLERGLAQTNSLLKASIIMQKRIAYDAAYKNYKMTRL